MKSPENGEKLIENLLKVGKNSKNPLAKYLKYTGRIESVSEYDEYAKEYLLIPLIEFTIQVLVIRPLVIFSALLLCLSALGFFLKPPPMIFLSAEGISLLWYLIVQFKEEMVNRNGKRI